MANGCVIILMDYRIGDYYVRRHFHRNFSDGYSQAPKSMARSSIDFNRSHSSRSGGLGRAARCVRDHATSAWRRTMSALLLNGAFSIGGRLNATSNFRLLMWWTAPATGITMCKLRYQTTRAACRLLAKPGPTEATETWSGVPPTPGLLGSNFRFPQLRTSIGIGDEGDS